MPEGYLLTKEKLNVSFISYQTSSEETQDGWNGFIPIPSNMAMKIVSAKRGLKSDLNKMEEVWIPTGVEIRVVGYADNYGRYLKK